MNRRDVCWVLIGAIALIASLAGHVMQLALESAHFFGGVRAFYDHSVQTPFAQLALALLLVAAFFIARGIIEGVREEFEGADWLVPALDMIRRIEPYRLAALVIALQLASLTIGELTEQVLSSYDAFGLAAIYGPGHFSAPFVHAILGTLAALVLLMFARAACDKVVQVARVARLIVAWLERPARIHCAPALRTLALRAETPPPPPLGRHIAGRPPPLCAALVA